jgi:hypothetical protein
MESTIYSDGTYLANNPGWHADDSAWKAGHIARLLEKNWIAPRTLCEIGCGAGEVLCSLSTRLDPSARLIGYDISPSAFAICSRKSSERVTFRLANLLDTDERYDVAMAIDVFEHVEDYFGFLRKLRAKADYKVFHIPLELSAQEVLRGRPLIEARRKVGHIHHFSKDTALATLEDCGYTVIEHFYTAWCSELPTQGWKSALLKWPRAALFRLKPDLAVRALGGYSLMVLAR